MKAEWMSGTISRMMEGDLLSWMFVISAILLEIIGTTCTKLSEGLTKVGPSVLMLACYCGTCILIALAVKRLEIGIVYAIWCGLGITAMTLIGIFIFNELSSPPKLIGIALILAGTLILELLPFIPESTPSEEIPQERAVSSPADTVSSQVPLQPSEESGP
jgi:small multidrug resistance pump